MYRQSFSAVSLASGFEHAIQKAQEEGKLLRNLIVVHDSCENMVPVDYLFEIKQFYDKHFLQYAKDCYGIYFAYDLELGVGNYGEMVGLKVIDDNNIEVSGTGSVIQKLLWKIENESELEVGLDVPKESIVPQFEENPMIRFIIERQCCMIHDYSYYKVKLTKLN